MIHNSIWNSIRMALQNNSHIVSIRRQIPWWRSYSRSIVMHSITPCRNSSIMSSTRLIHKLYAFKYATSWRHSSINIQNSDSKMSWYLLYCSSYVSPVNLWHSHSWVTSLISYTQDNYTISTSSRVAMTLNGMCSWCSNCWKLYSNCQQAHNRRHNHISIMISLEWHSHCPSMHSHSKIHS